ncbi:hypothetical protein D3C73_1001550 [compost metagenome]
MVQRHDELTVRNLGPIALVKGVDIEFPLVVRPPLQRQIGRRTPAVAGPVEDADGVRITRALNRRIGRLPVHGDDSAAVPAHGVEIAQAGV